MSPSETLMRAWLESGTPGQQLHAAARLGLPFPAETHDAPAAPPVSPRGDITPRPPSPPRVGWPACPYRDDSCGCSARECRHPANGPRFGTPVAVRVPGVPEATAYRVTPARCAACVAPATPP